MSFWRVELKSLKNERPKANIMPRGTQRKTGKVEYSGLEVVKAVRKLRGNIPIICLSVAAQRNAEIALKLQELGVNEIVAKPVRPSILLERVKLALLVSREPPQSEMLLEEIRSRRHELNSDNTFTRIRAIWALGEIGHYEPPVIAVLEDVSKNDNDRNVKIAADEP